MTQDRSKQALYDEVLSVQAALQDAQAALRKLDEEHKDLKLLIEALRTQLESDLYAWDTMQSYHDEHGASEDAAYYEGKVSAARLTLHRVGKLL